MKKKMKKAFTLVELLVVIAILAVLSTVAVVGYNSFIDKANLSNDQTTITMINRTLMAEEVLDKPESISDTMNDLRSNGFSYAKLEPYSKGYTYGYSKDLNRFVLIDDKNKVVYPEEYKDTSLASLWAPYRDHATSMVSGITNYYAVELIDNQVEFDSSFANGEYVLDLNDNLCTVVGRSNVTVLNGSVINDGFGSSSTSNKVQTNVEPETIGNKKVYKNALNPEAGAQYGYSSHDMEYLNCVFTNFVQFYQWGNTARNITFTNCKFVGDGSDGFAITLQPGVASVNSTTIVNNPGPTEQSTVNIDGCEFINFGRGIHVADWENTTVNISNCTFSLAILKSASNALQVSNYETIDGVSELKGLTINFTNNKVESAHGVIYFHDGMKNAGNIDDFKGILNFSNNQYNENVVKIADRGEYESGHLLYNNPEGMAVLAALIK